MVECYPERRYQFETFARFTSQKTTKQAQKKPRHDSSTPHAGSGALSTLADDEILTLLDKAKNCDKYHALLRGDITGYGHDDGGSDDSKADEALCCLITFYTDDAAQIERIFNRSKLADRDKWRDRADYRKLTIDAAIAFVTERYQPFRRSKGSRQGKCPNDNNRQIPKFTVGPLTFHPGRPRRSPSGVVRVPIQVYKAGDLCHDFVLSSTPSSWKNQSRILIQIITEEPSSPAEPLKTAEVERVFRVILADAAKRVDTPVVAERDRRWKAL